MIPPAVMQALVRLARRQTDGIRSRSGLRRKPACLSLDTLEDRRCLAAVPLHAAVTTGHHDLAHHGRAVLLHAAVPPAGTIAGQVRIRHLATPMRNVTVNLYDPAGNLLSSTVTNRNGRYSFNGLVAGNYLIEEVPPRGFTQRNSTFPNYPPTAQATPAGGFGDAPGYWNYTGSGGAAPPSDWVVSGTRAPFESAINITGATVNLASHLAIDYATTTQYTQQVVSSSVGGLGYQLQANGFAAENKILVNGTEFQLTNVHFHEATENIVNGVPPGVMEIHFVNQSAAGGEAVLAVFIKVGRSNPTLGRFFGSLSTLSTAGGSTQPGTAVGPLVFQDLLPRNLDGWFYSGSLTTPPLSTPVSFFVLAKPIEMSLTQFQQYQIFATSAGFFPNNRPVQPLDGRQMNCLTAVTLGQTAGISADIVNVRSRRR
jgi:carbonic anhydrase